MKDSQSLNNQRPAHLLTVCIDVAKYPDDLMFAARIAMRVNPKSFVLIGGNEQLEVMLVNFGFIIEVIQDRSMMPFGAFELVPEIVAEAKKQAARGN